MRFHLAALICLGLLPANACDVPTGAKEFRGFINEYGYQSRQDSYEISWEGGKFDKCIGPNYGRWKCGGKEFALQDVQGICNGNVVAYGNSGKGYCSTLKDLSKIKPDCNTIGQRTKFVTRGEVGTYNIDNSDLTFKIKWIETHVIKIPQNPASDF